MRPHYSGSTPPLLPLFAVFGSKHRSGHVTSIFNYSGHPALNIIKTTKTVSLGTLTLLRHVVFLCLSLHLFAPSLQPLGFIVEELHEPAAVPAEGGHASCLGALHARPHQPGLGLRAGRPTGRPVVLPVAEQALGAHRADGPVLGRRAGLRVATEGAAELQALVLHGGKPLQLHVRLHRGGHAVRALEPSLPDEDSEDMLTR